MHLPDHVYFESRDRDNRSVTLCFLCAVRSAAAVDCPPIDAKLGDPDDFHLCTQCGKLVS